MQIHARAQRHGTALMQASFFGRSDIVALLVANGADIDVKNESGQDALVYSINCCNIEVTQQLILARSVPFLAMIHH